MIDEYVKIGMTAKMYLSVSVKGENDADRQPCICVGKIEKILSEHEVEIEVLHQSEESFSKKETYVMYFIAPLEACMCHVSCLASYHDEQKKILSFKILSPLEKVQRRMHERISYHAELAFRTLSEPMKERKEDQQELFTEVSDTYYKNYEDTVVDISGGGIRFTSKKCVKPNECILADFKTIQGGKSMMMHVFGQVVYCQALRNEKDVFDIRMKYIHLSEAKKEQIIRFVFQLEREQRNVKLRRGGE